MTAGKQEWNSLPILGALPDPHARCHKSWLAKRAATLMLIADGHVAFTAMAREALASGRHLAQELGISDEALHALLTGETLLDGPALRAAEGALLAHRGTMAPASDTKSPLEVFWDVRATDRLNWIWLEHRYNSRVSQVEFCESVLRMKQSGFSLYLSGQPIGQKALNRFSAAFGVSHADIRPEFGSETSEGVGAIDRERILSQLRKLQAQLGAIDQGALPPAVLSTIKETQKLLAQG